MVTYICYNGKSDNQFYHEHDHMGKDSYIRLEEDLSALMMISLFTKYGNKISSVVARMHETAKNIMATTKRENVFTFYTFTSLTIIGAFYITIYTRLALQ